MPNLTSRTWCNVTYVSLKMSKLCSSFTPFFSISSDQKLLSQNISFLKWTIYKYKIIKELYGFELSIMNFILIYYYRIEIVIIQTVISKCTSIKLMKVLSFDFLAFAEFFSWNNLLIIFYSIEKMTLYVKTWVWVMTFCVRYFINRHKRVCNWKMLSLCVPIFWNVIFMVFRMVC